MDLGTRLKVFAYLRAKSMPMDPDWNLRRPPTARRVFLETSGILFFDLSLVLSEFVDILRGVLL